MSIALNLERITYGAPSNSRKLASHRTSTPNECFQIGKGNSASHEFIVSEDQRVQDLFIIKVCVRASVLMPDKSTCPVVVYTFKHDSEQDGRTLRRKLAFASGPYVLPPKIPAAPD